MIISILIAAIKAVALGGGGMIVWAIGVRHAMGVKDKKR